MVFRASEPASALSGPKSPVTRWRKKAAGLGPAFAVLTPEVAGLCKHPGA
jgi:hypothetical protein